jgi:hypothetical protein
LCDAFVLHPAVALRPILRAVWRGRNALKIGNAPRTL